MESFKVAGLIGFPKFGFANFAVDGGFDRVWLEHHDLRLYDGWRDLTHITNHLLRLDLDETGEMEGLCLNIPRVRGARDNRGGCITGLGDY